MTQVGELIVPAPRTGDQPARGVRERIIDTAGRMISTVGWQQVTMAKVASGAGVSRQTVYNEVGNKAGLAHAMVEFELAKAMELVTGAFEANPDDIVGGVREAVVRVLRRAEDHKLLTAIASASAGSDSLFLPLLTTHGQVLLDSAKIVIRMAVDNYQIDIEEDLLEATIDAMVRLVISHMVQPAFTPEKAADDLAAITAHVLS